MMGKCTPYEILSLKIHIGIAEVSGSHIQYQNYSNKTAKEKNINEHLDKSKREGSDRTLTDYVV